MPGAEDQYQANSDLFAQGLKGWKLLGFNPVSPWPLERSRDGKAVPLYNGRPIHSRVKPLEEARRRVAEVVMEGVERVIYLPGDFLYDLEALLEAPRPRLKRLDVVFHHGALLESLWASRDLSFLKKYSTSIFFHVLPDPKGIQSLTQSGIQDMARTRFLGNPVLTQALAPWSNAVLAGFRESFRGLASRAFTQYHFERRWTLNLLHNLRADRSWAQFQGVHKRSGGDVILVGAGPSLATQMPYLKDLRPRVCLVAVDTALRPLLMAGLIPDLVVALDGGYFNTLDFECLPPVEVPLAMDVACHPMIGRLWQGPVALFSSRPQNGGSGDLRQRLLSQAGLASAVPVVDTAGHITHTALGVLHHLGALRVGLVGLDMAFPFLESHGPSTCHQAFAYRRSGRLGPMPTQNFKLVRHRALEVYVDRAGRHHFRDEHMAQHPSLLDRACQGWGLMAAHVAGGLVAHPGEIWERSGTRWALPPVTLSAWNPREAVNDLLEQLKTTEIDGVLQNLSQTPVDEWTGRVVNLPIIGPGSLALVMALSERGKAPEAQRLSSLQGELERFRKLVFRRLEKTC